MKEDLDLFSINVANVIGNNVDPFIVKEIISISNNEKYIFHGIKNNNCFYRINIEGIKPLFNIYIGAYRSTKYESRTPIRKSLPDLRFLISSAMIEM